MALQEAGLGDVALQEVLLLIRGNHTRGVSCCCRYPHAKVSLRKQSILRGTIFFGLHNLDRLFCWPFSATPNCAPLPWHSQLLDASKGWLAPPRHVQPCMANVCLLKRVRPKAKPTHPRNAVGVDSGADDVDGRGWSGGCQASRSGQEQPTGPGCRGGQITRARGLAPEGRSSLPAEKMAQQTNVSPAAAAACSSGSARFGISPFRVHATPQ